MSRLCAGCASQNSVLVVRFTAKFYVWGVFVPPCAGPNPVGFAHWSSFVTSDFIGGVSLVKTRNLCGGVQ
jgi:hypothetical protein